MNGQFLAVGMWGDSADGGVLGIYVAFARLAVDMVSLVGGVN